MYIKLIILTFILSPLSNYAQSDTSYIEFDSKMYFISEIDHSSVYIDEDGNQFDYYNNYIVVYNKGTQIKIPYDSNYIFWDKYDENIKITKKVYKITIKVLNISKIKKKYVLWKVYDKYNLIFDRTKKNPFKP